MAEVSSERFVEYDVLKVDNLGRVVIPKALREKLGIAPCSRVKLSFNGKQMLLEPYCPNGDVQASLIALRTMLEPMRGVTPEDTRRFGEAELCLNEIAEIFGVTLPTL